MVESDTTKVYQDTSTFSQHDIDDAILKDVYSELLDVEKQIRATHNWLVDLNYISPGVERKIKEKLDDLNARLDNVSTQLDSITDKSMKTKAKPYKVTLKDCRQKLAKCSGMLKKKGKM
jgi:paraquat-inducible protein B